MTRLTRVIPSVPAALTADEPKIPIRPCAGIIRAPQMKPSTRSRRVGTAISWGLLVLVFAAASILTGWSILGLLGAVPPPSPGGHNLTPPDLASMAVAGATLLLASVTVLLALFTRGSLALSRLELALAEDSLKVVRKQGERLAEQVAATQTQAAAIQGQTAATQQQAAIAQRTLETSWRPLLVDVPFGFAVRRIQGPFSDVSEEDAALVVGIKRPDGSGRVIVPFRNIGSGPAIITRAVLSFGQLHSEATFFSSSIVAIREVVRIRFDVVPARAVLISLVSQLESGQPFTVAVFYGDQGGVGTWRSRAHLHRPLQASRYEVLNVELYEGDATTPFATSGGGAPT